MDLVNESSIENLTIIRISEKEYFIWCYSIDLKSIN